MVDVRTADGTQDIELAPLTDAATAAIAAQTLFASVHQASKDFGGRALIRTPEDGEDGFVIFWEGGPEQWADAYVVAPESDSKAIAVEAVDGTKVRINNLD